MYAYIQKKPCRILCPTFLKEMSVLMLLREKGSGVEENVTFDVTVAAIGTHR